MSNITRRGSLVLAMAALLLTMAGEFAAILTLNDGLFIFTLDDAYIHLALAENMARGHYGVNLGEYSAPSSSIIWPFLLTPFARSGPAPLIVLALNTLLAGVTVLCIWRIFFPPAADDEPASVRFLRTLMLLCAVFGTHLTPVAYMGMEHSLQILSAAMILCGLVVETESKRVPPWLLLAIAAAPIIRYEGLALALPAAAYLFARGRRVSAAACVVTAALVMGIFSLFLMNLGLGPLPTSVIAKSAMAGSMEAFGPVLGNVARSLRSPRGVLLVAALLLLMHAAFARQRRREERLLALAAAAAVALHVAAGPYGAYYRYSAYIWLWSSVAVLYVHRDAWLALPRQMNMAGAAGLILAGWTLLAAPMFAAHFTTPIASNNIYQQQHQMGRFVSDFYRKPAAVNDLGAVSYQNDHYVLDFIGLASREALERRTAHQGHEWMQDMARAKNVGLIMLYSEWFPSVPPTWIKLGELRLSRRKITPAFSGVDIYARTPEDAEEILPVLERFQPTLPEEGLLTLNRTN